MTEAHDNTNREAVMLGPVRRWSVVVVAMVLMAVAAAGCTDNGRSKQDTPVLAGGRASPVSESPIPNHDCFAQRRDVDSLLRKPGAFKIVGPITNVPEFHDCQRLLLNRGKDYGPLVAIYAAYYLESFEKRLDSVAKLYVKTGTPAIAAALIVNADDDYKFEELKINHGYSCLYVWRGPTVKGWQAEIVPMSDPQKCIDPITAPTTGGTLQVYADSAKDFVDADFPPVARWDWDHQRRQQYIGIKCGLAWCEVGTKSFVHGPPYLQNPSGHSPTERVQRIKGWYDDQLLAEADPTTPTPPHLRARAAHGYVIPDPTADALAWTDYAGKWPNVAFVGYVPNGATSNPYKKKLNMDSTRPNADTADLNHLAFCWGERAECNVPADVPSDSACTSDGPPTGTPAERHPWWARMTGAAQDHSKKYGCVTRIDHSAEVKSIPHTARWSWKEEDETIWKECLTGCCKVSSFQ